MKNEKRSKFRGIVGWQFGEDYTYAIDNLKRMVTEEIKAQIELIWNNVHIDSYIGKDGIAIIMQSPSGESDHMVSIRSLADQVIKFHYDDDWREQCERWIKWFESEGQKMKAALKETKP